MRRARAVVQGVLAGGEPVYGLTTGAGERKAFLLDPAERRQFNLRLVLNHRIAQGAPGSPRSSSSSRLRPSTCARSVTGPGASGPGASGLGELGVGTGRAYRMIRELVPFTQADGTFPADLEPVVDLVTPGPISPQPLDPPRHAVTMTACSPCESVKAPSVTASATAPVPARARRTSPPSTPEPGTSRPAPSSPAREISAVRPGRLRRPLAPAPARPGSRGPSDHLLSPPARRSPLHVSA